MNAAVTRDDLLSQLTEGIRRLTTSEAWLAWMRTQSRFYRYSFGNTLLIAWQRPDASLVAGYRRWLELGRQVRQGETGIRILAPCRYRTARDGDNDDDGADLVDTVRSFRVAVVFALEQTDGEPLPELPIARVLGDDPDRVLRHALRSSAGARLPGCSRLLRFPEQVRRDQLRDADGDDST